MQCSFLIFLLLAITACTSAPKTVSKYYRPIIEREALPYTISADTEALYAKYFILSAQIYALRGYEQKALLDLRTALRLNKDRPRVLYLMAQLHTQQGQFAEASDALKASIDLAPTAAEPYVLLGKLQSDVFHKPELALLCFDKALELDPNNQEVPHYRVALLLAAERLADAETAIEAALLLHPKDERMLELGGNLALQMGAHERAERRFTALVSLSPRSEIAVLKLSEIKDNSGDTTGALDLLELFSKENEATPAIYKKIAQLNTMLKRPEAARKAMEQALLLDGENAEVLFEAARLFAEQQEYARATEILDRAIARYPSAFSFKYLLAIIKEEQQQHEEALALLDQVTVQDDLFEEATLQAAAIKKKHTGNATSSLSFLQDRLSMRPDAARIAIYLASLLEEAGQLPQGLAILKESLAHQEHNALLHYYIGIFQDKSGNKDEAIKAIERAISIDPENPEYLNYLGYTYAELGKNLDTAEELLIKANKLRPNDGFFIDSLGWVHYKRKEYSKALSLLEQARTLKPTEAVIAEHCADAFSALGKRSEALRFYEEAVRLYKEQKDSRSAAEKNALENKIRKLKK